MCIYMSYAAFVRLRPEMSGVTCYELVLERPEEDGGPSRETHRFSSRFYQEPLPETLSCTLNDIKDGVAYKISVVPINAYDVAGEALTLDYAPGADG